MTREEAKYAIEVMQAYVDGKEIEFSLKHKNIWYTHDGDTVSDGEDIIHSLEFDFKKFDYRIKKEQEPVYRPFKDTKECWDESQKHQPSEYIINKENRLCRKILGWKQVGNGNIFIQLDNDDMYSSEDAFRLFTFADGTPFGIKKE